MIGGWCMLSYGCTECAYCSLLTWWLLKLLALAAQRDASCDYLHRAWHSKAAIPGGISPLPVTLEHHLVFWGVSQRVTPDVPNLKVCRVRL